MSEITRKEVIKSVNKIREFCEKNHCAGCPFGRSEDDGVECELAEYNQQNWDKKSILSEEEKVILKNISNKYKNIKKENGKIYIRKPHCAYEKMFIFDGLFCNLEQKKVYKITDLLAD